MAEDKESNTVKVTETVTEPTNEDAPLTRKRTRDDFEEGDEGKETEQETRKIAPLKRRKDVADESKDSSSEKVGEAVVVEETANDEGVPEEKVEVAKETKEAVVTSEESKATEEEEKPKDDKPAEEPKKEGKDEKKEEKIEETSDKKDENKKDEKPKFVFGSTTPFGANAFSLLNKNKNVFDASSKESSKSPSVSTPSVFGSNSKFGNAFQSAVTKKSIFDKTPEEQAKEKEEVEKSRETTPATSGNLYKQVELEKKDIKSGEEDEEQVFTCRAKLYALDLTNVKEGWKERGIGNVHVNKAKDGEKARVIMRSIGLLKVILNTPLIVGLEVVKGMPSSLASEKFIRITIVEDKKPIQYALKTGNPETTLSLYESIVDLIPK